MQAQLLGLVGQTKFLAAKFVLNWVCVMYMQLVSYYSSPSLNDIVHFGHSNNITSVLVMN